MRYIRTRRGGREHSRLHASEAMRPTIFFLLLAAGPWRPAAPAPIIIPTLTLIGLHHLLPAILPRGRGNGTMMAEAGPIPKLNTTTLWGPRPLSTNGTSAHFTKIGRAGAILGRGHLATTLPLAKARAMAINVYTTATAKTVAFHLGQQANETEEIMASPPAPEEAQRTMRSLVERSKSIVEELRTIDALLPYNPEQSEKAAKIEEAMQNKTMERTERGRRNAKQPKCRRTNPLLPAPTTCRAPRILPLVPILIGTGVMSGVGATAALSTEVHNSKARERANRQALEDAKRDLQRAINETREAISELHRLNETYWIKRGGNLTLALVERRNLDVVFREWLEERGIYPHWQAAAAADGVYDISPSLVMRHRQRRGIPREEVPLILEFLLETLSRDLKLMNWLRQRKLFLTCQLDPKEDTSSENKEIEKRFAPVAVAGFTALGSLVATTAFGTYTSTQISSLSARLDGQEAAASVIAMTIDEIKGNSEKEFGRIKENLVKVKRSGDFNWALTNMDSAVNYLTQNAHRLTRAVNAALRGNWDVALVTPEAVDGALKDISVQAKERDLIPMVDRAKDLPHLETSYIRLPGGDLALMAHVPLTNQKFQLDVYQYTATPMRRGNDLIRFRPEKRFFVTASRNADHFRAMSGEELNACTRIGKTFLCEDVTFLHKDGAGEEVPRTPDHCLHALYVGRIDRAMLACPVETIDAAATVEEVAPGLFTLYTSNEQKAFMSCHGEEPTRFTIQGLTSMIIPPGCHVSTDEIVAFGPSDEFAAMPNLVAPLEGITNGLLDVADTAMNRIRAYGQGPATTILANSAESKWVSAHARSINSILGNPDQRHRSTFLHNLGLATVIAVAVGAALAVGYFCLRRRRKPQRLQVREDLGSLKARFSELRNSIFPADSEDGPRAPPRTRVSNTYEEPGTRYLGLAGQDRSGAPK